MISFMACSKDEGNYNYNEVNKLTILDVEGEDISGRSYDLTIADTIPVEIKLESKFSQFNQEKAEIYWLIKKDTVAKGSMFKMTSEFFKSGENFVTIIAKDYLSNVEYHSTFRVNFNAGLSKGYFLLAEGENKQGILYLKSSLKPDSKFVGMTAFGSNNEFPIGTEPLNIYLSYYNLKYTSIMIATKKGEFPFMEIGISNLLPSYLIKSSGNGIDGGDFHPTNYRMNHNQSTSNGYFAENGKIRNVVNRFLANDIINVPGIAYNFGANNYVVSNLSADNGRILMGYDEISKRIYQFSNFTSYRNYYNTLDLSYCSEVLEGKECWGVGGDVTTASGFGNSYSILMRTGNQVFNYQGGYDVNSTRTKYIPVAIKLVSTGTIDNIDKAIGLKLNRFNKNFYYAIGRTIYRFSFLSFNTQPYFTLPEDGTGDIVAFDFDKADNAVGSTHIGIATYNQNSSESKKGSFYHYEIKEDGNGNPLTLFNKSLYQVDKTVALIMGIK